MTAGRDSSDGDRNAQIDPYRSPGPVPTNLPRCHDRPLAALHLSSDSTPDGWTLVTLDVGGRLRSWRSGQLDGAWRAHTGPAVLVADGATIHTGGVDGLLRTWSIDEGVVTPSSSLDLDTPIRALELEHGSLVVTTDDGRSTLEPHGLQPRTETRRAGPDPVSLYLRVRFADGGAPEDVRAKRLVRTTSLSAWTDESTDVWLTTIDGDDEVEDVVAHVRACERPRLLATDARTGALVTIRELRSPGELRGTDPIPDGARRWTLDGGVSSRSFRTRGARIRALQLGSGHVLLVDDFAGPELIELDGLRSRDPLTEFEVKWYDDLTLLHESPTLIHAWGAAQLHTIDLRDGSKRTVDVPSRVAWTTASTHDRILAIRWGYSSALFELDEGGLEAMELPPLVGEVLALADDGSSVSTPAEGPELVVMRPGKPTHTHRLRPPYTALWLGSTAFISAGDGSLLADTEDGVERVLEPGGPVIRDLARSGRDGVLFVVDELGLAALRVSDGAWLRMLARGRETLVVVHEQRDAEPCWIHGATESLWIGPEPQRREHFDFDRDFVAAAAICEDRDRAHAN